MGDLIARRRRVRRRLKAGRSVLVSFSLVLAAGCSGSEATSSPTDAPTASSEPLPTDAATTSPSFSTTTTTTTTTTTEPVPVVDTVPSTDETTSAPITDPPDNTEVAAPANTTFDPSTPSGEVEQISLANLAAFATCLEQLPNCDIEALTSTASLEYADGNARLASEWNEAGYIARDTDDYNYRVDAVEFSEDGTEAIVSYCVWGGTQLILPATDTTPEEIIDGEYTSSTKKYLVRRLGDSWFVTANDPVERSVGESNNICV